MSSPLAPIALFVYKRPAHTRAVLTALRNCRGSDRSLLRIYCDGPKRPEDASAVEEVRRIAKSEKWCGTVEVVERSENWGLSKSVRTGVGDLCEQFGKVIVIEDDLELHPSFLEFMNSGLARYENENRVMQISGYSLPVPVENRDDAYFLQMGSCWGWGTWKRAWKQFDDSDRLYRRLQSDSGLRRRFDWNGTYAYFAMLEKQLAGKLDSWGIFWHQTVFQNDGLVLMPNRTLVVNRGADGSGTHVALDGHQDVMSDREAKILPEKVEESPMIVDRITRYMNGRQRWSFLPAPVRAFAKKSIGFFR